MNKTTKLLAAFALTAMATPAFAHTGAGHADGMAAGLAHPLMGMDHLLAMLSVGIWSAVASPGRTLSAPFAFVSAMLAGAGLAFAGIALPGVENMIAVSVLATGLMVILSAGMAPSAGLGLVGLFALFHGHAHAGEASGAVAAYVAGFSVSTMAIHLAGISIGRLVSAKPIVRYGLGLAVAGSGLAFLSGL